MNAGEEQTGVIGRAKTVLVFGEGAHARAVITAIIAQPAKRTTGPRLSFEGLVGCAAETKLHIQKVVMRLFDCICNLLGLEGGAFDLSGVNLGAASIQDRGTEIRGHSGSVAVLLTLLSARLRFSLPQDFLCTGHIASVVGDIRPVRHLVPKLEAASLDNTITRFVYPALDADASVATLNPAEYARERNALASASDRVKLVPVRDVDELLRSIVPEEAVVTAALTCHYLRRQPSDAFGGGAVGRAARFLGENIWERFFDVLHSRLSGGHTEVATGLLEKWVHFWIEERCYPSGFGKKLRQLILSVPPSVRLQKLRFPLLPVGDCIKLSQSASGRDSNDVLELYSSVSGSVAEPGRLTHIQQSGSESSRISESGTLAIVLAEISQEHLARFICLPIDSARASFVVDSVTAEDSTQAWEVITSFFIHLLRYTHRSAEYLTFDLAGPEARSLLERTFAHSGGSVAGIAEAQSGVRGGLRFVLDSMTEQFKRECREKHVSYVLATAIDPLDWRGRVRFVQELFEHCRDVINPEALTEAPARYARHYELLVRTYVNGLDEVKQLLRSL